MIDNYGYDVVGWIGFLGKLNDMMLDVIGKIPVDNEELLIDAAQDIKKLESTIKDKSTHQDNWIVSKVVEGPRNEGVVNVELKPLDISSYCTACWLIRSQFYIFCFSNLFYYMQVF